MKLTRKGKIAVGILILLGALALVYISTHIWWTGSGYCFGSAVKCLGGAL